MTTGTEPPAPAKTATVDVVVPVFNEERSLPGCLRVLDEFLTTSFPFRSTITVVDNASTDGTLDVARSLVADHERVRVVHLDRKGRGLALREAWSASDADVVVYMDVDLSTGLEALLPLVAPLVNGHSDLSIGSRLAPGARTVRGPRREFISRAYNQLIRLMHGARFTDAQCGFKAARTDVVRPLLEHVQDDSWFFDTELLLLAEHNGLRIHEVPVDWVEDTDSRVDVIGTAWDDVRGLLRMARAKASGRARVAGLPRRPEPRATHPDAVLGRREGDLAWQLLLHAGRKISPTSALGLPARKGHLMAARNRWRTGALVAICLLAGLLYVWEIGGGQLGNTYYSAAVRSMTESFSNFLFGSFDPYGVITVDKPPMALWPQVISVLVFGFHGWSLLLPQVIEGVAAVFLLHRTVRLWAGENVALLAALIFALTPVTVVINRDNNPDTLLVLLLVAAAYAVTRSVQAPSARRRTTWLLWCAFFVGCGFLTKMLQAWIVVPAVALAFLVGTTGPLKRRILDLLGAGGVLVASSFWWVALHDWWPGSTPYVGGSADGSAWDLIVGYNGFGRIFGGDQGGGMVIGTPNGETKSGSFGGDPGLLRMFNELVGGQISWLLPLALFVLLVVSVAGVRAMRRTAAGDPAGRAGWFLWGGWLLITALVFSFAKGIMHPYYTTAMAPAVAAICAAGVAVLWRWYRASDAWALLPAGIAITAAWAFVLVSRDTSWYGWCRWAVVVVAGAAVVALIVGRFSVVRRTAIGRPALAVAVAAFLLTPGVWSVAAATVNPNGNTPAAGPAIAPGPPPTGPAPVVQPGPGRRTPGGPGGPGLVIIGGGSGETKLTDEQRRILEYAERNGDGAEIALAVNGASGAVAPFIMETDSTVIGMGGFGGQDDVPSTDQLQRWVNDDTLRYILSAAPGQQTQPMPSNGARAAVQQKRQAWIEQHSTVVAPAAYGSKPPAASAGRPTVLGGAPDTLYRCGEQ
ncbi:glycosyltransferase family 39 protein [Kribbella speibonae]|nr:glycosyltransferase family 39 protein [Kribbella speibonae]